MQLVTREQLFKLAGTSVIGEAEEEKEEKEKLDQNVESDFAYDEFKTFWKKTNDDIKKAKLAKTTDKQIQLTYEYTLDWLKNKKDIEYVGVGSSRAAFALNGGKCLKIAMFKRGIAQNKQEAENYSKNIDLDCFTQIYDYDKPNYSSILTECCTEATEEDFAELYGLQAYEICDQLIIFEEVFRKYKDVQLVIKNLLDNNNKRNKILKKRFWKNCLTNKKVQWDIIRDLLNFYKNNTTKLIIDDLALIENWGLTIRRHKLVLVILDYGMSDDVVNKYYTR